MRQDRQFSCFMVNCRSSLRTIAEWIKVSNGISIEGDTKQTLMPYLEQQSCHFLETFKHCCILALISRQTRCNRAFICVGRTKISPEVFTQSFPGEHEKLGACITIIFILVTHIPFPYEVCCSLRVPSLVKVL